MQDLDHLAGAYCVGLYTKNLTHQMMQTEWLESQIVVRIIPHLPDISHFLEEFSGPETEIGVDDMDSCIIFQIGRK